jgi:hypothetical protein
MDDAPAPAIDLMWRFAKRTGLHPRAPAPQRYLWTDAFAVCNFLALFEQTSNELFRRCATTLIDQVHWVLGRYRDDDERSGWISGLDEHTGALHPTAGGLRIGKPIKERKAGERFDELREWDRDGQYFHYLTKWIHAFVKPLSSPATRNMQAGRLNWEQSLSRNCRRSAVGNLEGMHWKMSTDLELSPNLGDRRGQAAAA